MESLYIEIVSKNKELFSKTDFITVFVMFEFYHSMWMKKKNIKPDFDRTTLGMLSINISQHEITNQSVRMYTEP